MSYGYVILLKVVPCPFPLCVRTAGSYGNSVLNCFPQELLHYTPASAMRKGSSFSTPSRTLAVPRGEVFELSGPRALQGGGEFLA